jgi:hypothetical protein
LLGGQGAQLAENCSVKINVAPLLRRGVFMAAEHSANEPKRAPAATPTVKPVTKESDKGNSASYSFSVSLGTQSTSEQPKQGFWNSTSKDVLDSLVGLINSWPLALVLLAIILRNQLRPLFKRLLKMSGFGVELEFEKELDELEAIKDSYLETRRYQAQPPPLPSTIPAPTEHVAEAEPEGVVPKPVAAPFAPADDLSTFGSDEWWRQVEEAAVTSPAMGVQLAYSALNHEGQRLAMMMNIPAGSLVDIVTYLIRDGALPAMAALFARKLTELRNSAAHSAGSYDTISVKSASKYVSFAKSLAQLFTSIRTRRNHP